MTTVLEKLKGQLAAQSPAADAETSLRRAFIVFAGHARTCYQYSAVKLKGSEGSTLLGRPQDEIVTVDCASLADALVLFLNDLLPDQVAKRVEVRWAGNFATAANSRCFDVRVSGNVRTPRGDWADTGRCIFAEHHFVETGAATRWYLDPCLFTQYSAPDEVMSWKLTAGGGAFSSYIRFIEGDPSQLLVRAPVSDLQSRPRGFESGMILFPASEFTANQLAAFRGKRLNPGWSSDKFTQEAGYAHARAHVLLRKAGVTGDWPA